MVCRGRVERKILPEEVLMFNSGVGNISKIGGGGAWQLSTYLILEIYLFIPADKQKEYQNSIKLLPSQPNVKKQQRASSFSTILILPRAFNQDYTTVSSNSSILRTFSGIYKDIKKTCENAVSFQF